MDRLAEEIANELTIELGIVKDSDKKILLSKVKNVMNEIADSMNYPEFYEEKHIVRDLRKKRSVIHNVALYDYNQIGAEGETSHSESGIARSYVDRAKLFTFVPFSKIAR